jgi:predicted nucleotidyltransferase
VSDHVTVTGTDERREPQRLDERARASLAAALDRPDVVAGFLFGSQARGNVGVLSDVDVRLRAERALQLAIQIAIDVGAHLVSELGLSPPDATEAYSQACETAA